MDRIEKINISIAAISKLIKTELINNYPHGIIEYIFKKDKEILLFFGKSILESLKKLEKDDLIAKEIEGSIEVF